MALDEAILDAVAANAAPPTVRLYQWKRPTVTVGRFQNVARTIDREACERRCIPLVRRITGGRGILHGNDLTVSLIASQEALGFAVNASVSTLALYRRIAEGFLCAFARAGIAATPDACRRQKSPGGQGDCFASVSQADVVESGSGRKLMGAALHRREHFLLEQVSIPFTITPSPYEGEGQALTSPNPLLTKEGANSEGTSFLREGEGQALTSPSLCEGEGRGGVASVFLGKNAAARAGYGIAVDSIAAWREILAAELMRALEAPYVTGRVSAAESARAKELIAVRYGKASWTETGTRPSATHEIDRAVRL